MQVTPKLTLRKSHDYAHPVIGTLSPGKVRVLFKVTRRRAAAGAPQPWTARAVGVVHHTFKFDALADFQYLPKQFIAGMDSAYISTLLRSVEDNRNAPPRCPVPLPRGCIAVLCRDGCCGC